MLLSASCTLLLKGLSQFVFAELLGTIANATYVKQFHHPRVRITNDSGAGWWTNETGE